MDTRKAGKAILQVEISVLDLWVKVNSSLKTPPGLVLLQSQLNSARSSHRNPWGKGCVKDNLLCSLTFTGTIAVRGTDQGSSQAAVACFRCQAGEALQLHRDEFPAHHYQWFFIIIMLHYKHAIYSLIQITT